MRRELPASVSTLKTLMENMSYVMKDDRNAAHYAALAFSPQSGKGRPFRRQPRRVTTRIQNRLRCDPIIYGVFFYCRDSRLQMVVCRAGFVVGNAGIFHLQSLGLALVTGASTEPQLYLVDHS